MNDKILIAIISALGGGVFALVSTYLSGQMKMREMEFQKALHHSRSRLAAAHEKLSEVYLPIMAKVEKAYRTCCLYRADQTAPNKKAFTDAVEDLGRKYEELVGNGSVIFLLPQAREEIERLVVLLENSLGAKKAKHLFLTRSEGIGLRVVAERSYSGTGLILAFLLLLCYAAVGRLGRWFGPVMQMSFSFRVHSAPIGSEDFAQEFRTIVDVLRSATSDVALFDKTED